MEQTEQKIRVLHLIEHLKIGGAERVVTDLVNALDGNQIQSIICTYRCKGTFFSELRNAGFTVIYLPKNIFSDFFPPCLRFLTPLFLPIESLIFVIRLSLLIKNHDIQIVHSHLFSANLWGRLSLLFSKKRVGMITTEHTTFGWGKITKHFLFNKLLNPLSDRVVAVSHEVAKSIKRDLHIKDNKLVVIHNGIQTTTDSTTEKRKQTSLQAKLPGLPPRIAIIGRLIPVKRHDLFIKAIQISRKTIPVMSCYIIGDGPEKSRLEQLVLDAGLNKTIFFLGERSDIRMLLWQIDLVVNTSDHEGLPMSLLEAMAKSIPVVATDTGGIREIIENTQTGILVKPGDAQAIARGICNVLQDKEIAEKLGRMGQIHMKEDFSLEKTSRMWVKLYQDVMYEHQNIS